MTILLKACAVPSPIPASGQTQDSEITKQEAVRLVPVLDHLPYPVSVTHAGDQSGRLFITLQEGMILAYTETAGAPAVFLDIHDQVNCCGESGLLGLAFDPRFKANGLFYVDYINRDGETIVARYTADPQRTRAQADSEFVILRIKQPTSIHNGGQLAFGPDGYLYIGTGDGGSFGSGGDGSGGDPLNRAQQLDTLLGKILRIDVSNVSAPEKSYSIPLDNPFVQQADARGEIWALGLKNPWRFSFDRVNGDLYITDVGDNHWEEVNVQSMSSHGGENYGWHIMEGPECYHGGSNCNNGSLQLPEMAYSHDEGCAIIGGYVYRGKAYPQFGGQYVFGDYCTGKIWQMSRDADSWHRTQLADTSLNISSFGEDENGEIYVIGRDSSEGTVYRLSFDSLPEHQ